MKCKIFTRWATGLLIIVLCSYSDITATVIATSPESPNQYQTFVNPVHNKVYHRATGTIYLAITVGTDSVDLADLVVKDDNGSNETTNSRLAKAARPVGSQKPEFVDISNFIPLEYNIDLLALATEPCDTSPYLAFVDIVNTTSDQTKVHLITNDGKTTKESDDLKDAAGNVTCDIVAIEANKSYIFAAVSPGADESGLYSCGDPETYYGQPNSGIAVVCINPKTLGLTQTAAAGNKIIKAQKLDHETPQVKINSNVEFISDTSDLFWDHQLQRLYIGLELETGGNVGDGAKGVVVASVANGILTLYNIAPNNAFTAGTNNIVGSINSGAGAFVSIKHVRVMHCSTGPSYLVVNGGTLSPTEANNRIYALPLVDTNPLNPYNGTIADKNSVLQNHKFVQRATQANAGLPESSDPAALVGMGDLPILPSTPISDMVVVGDTVYVSMDTAPDANNDTGVLYSQALFDENGKIVRWTPWTKRAFPYDNQKCCSQGQVAFFDVDAVTGKLWAVEGMEKKVVCSTAWDLGTSWDSLPTKLNNVFSCMPCNKGCFSVLDLDHSTRGFSDEFTVITTTTHRYALFGGADTVVFARISQACSTLLSSPQKVIEDFSSPENFLTTRLEPCSGPVTTLEYSRRPITAPDNTGYFFAGTEKGLFVFADNNKMGFNVEDLQELDKPPFSTGKWYYIPNLPGSVIDIKTLGNRLYVITFETSCQHPLQSRLYGIDFKPNLNVMFDLNNIRLLADSGKDVLSNAYLFTGLEVVATGNLSDPLEKEQIILATNGGLFRSCADQQTGKGIITANTQVAAAWRPLPSGNTKPYWGITAPDALIPSTVWPIRIDDKSGCATFEHSSVQQISITGTTGCEDPTKDMFVPENFNAISDAPVFQALDPISHFWSDGARRFFVIKRPQDPYCLNRLFCLPYNTYEWCIINPCQSIIIDPVVWNTKLFYWVHQIGVSGILMAGTDNGVIALE